MPQVDSNLTTGLHGLDRVLKGLIPGDNIVWQVGRIEDYIPFVEPYCRAAEKLGQKLIYMRFAKHPPLVKSGGGAEIHRLHPEEGFEVFINSIHNVIEKTGRGGFYLFDCLSDLAAEWYSDQMLGNCFMLTCPYLYDMEALAYFALLRNHHSFHATSAILSTTQVLLDVYRHRDNLYMHPWKVQARYSATMHMLHILKDQDFKPVTESATIGEIRTSVPWSRLESGERNVGVWNKTFLAAEELLAQGRSGEDGDEQADQCLHQVLRMAITRDPRVLRLAEEHFTLADLVAVGQRMVGTGLIGGKSVGMLLARAILRQKTPDLAALLEPHDSFYIGSDVFYTFLVRNGLWWVRESQKDPRTFLEGAGRGRHRILMGDFPDYIQKQFEDMLDYFGQSPIIVRSSSLLEDNFGNAFAGKYESVFCANQGPRARRLDDFLSAVRTIYASSMSEKALTYRLRRGLLQQDEQMALLVQRVSGAMCGHLYFPKIAGVGFSFNPYVWNREIDANAGMMRLVFGLGTRAVDRQDDDYTRVVALNAPQRRPESNIDEVRKYSQHKVDVLDLEANQLLSMSFRDVVRNSPDLSIDLFASRDRELESRAAARGGEDVFPWVLTFDNLFNDTPVVQNMRDMLQTLHQAYDSPVDVEFTANFPEEGGYKINIVQCRPLQINEGGPAVAVPDVPEQDLILEAHGAVIGQSRAVAVDRIIYIVPSEYGRLTIRDRYAVARQIGRIVHLPPEDDAMTQMLLGPGRWGTTSPELGVPAMFSDINRVSLLCEIVTMGDGVAPDVSLGTHFFSDLVELDILYFALFPAREENVLNGDFLAAAENGLTRLVPKAAQWEHVIRVIDAADLSDNHAICVNADAVSQRVVCYLDRSSR